MHADRSWRWASTARRHVTSRRWCVRLPRPAFRRSPTPTPERSGIRCTDAGAVSVNRESSVPPPWVGGGPGRPWWVAAVAPAPNTSVRSVPTWAASREGSPPTADLGQGLDRCGLTCLLVLEETDGGGLTV